VALCAAFFISVAVTVSADVEFTVGRFNFVGAFNFLVAIAGGALAVFAVMGRGERGLLVFAALLPGLFVLGFEGAELIFPPY
jgi:cytochrome c oxidase subunit IV